MRALVVERLRPFALVAIAASGALNLALLILAICVLRLFDRVLAGRDGRALAIIGSIALLSAILAYAADRLRGGALASAGRLFDRELVPAAIANSLETLRDVELLRSFMGSPGMLALLDLPWLPLYLLAITWIHPLLGFAALASIALLIVVAALEPAARSFERSNSLLPAARAAGDQAEDLVRNAETLVAMGMSQTAAIAWRERHDQFLSRRQNADRGAARLGTLVRAGSLVLQVCMLALCAWLVTGSRLSVAAVIAATLLVNRALQPLEHLAGNWPATMAVRGAWLRLNRRATSIVVARTSAPMPAGRVELERVCYVPSVSRSASIKNLSLALAPGESILIIGSGGCGKTTLARLLLGVLQPYSGSVRLDGTDLARWDRAALGERVGYVSQDVRLFQGTIADNIARLGTLDSTRIVQAARLAHAHETIVRMPEGYHTEVCEAGACLSAGQRRRVALARALYVNPRLLVLDEPSADLDAAGEIALIKTLAELKARGTTVVIVGQCAKLAEHVDRLAILRDGMLQSFEPMEPLPYSSAAVVPLHRPVTQQL